MDIPGFAPMGGTTVEDGRSDIAAIESSGETETTPPAVGGCMGSWNDGAENADASSLLQSGTRTIVGQCANALSKYGFVTPMMAQGRGFALPRFVYAGQSESWMVK